MAEKDKKTTTNNTDKKKTTDKTTTDKNANKEKQNTDDVEDESSTPISVEDKLKIELENLRDTKLELIKSISSESDTTKKGKSKSLNKIYPYWAMIFKDGVRINSFGIREDTVNDVRLLTRTEKVDGETKVSFLQLYPEPKFDIHTVSQNKTQITKELNKLKQIQRRLEKERYEGKIKSYNYDISDVKILILQKEIELESIKYGKSFEYTHNLRDDGIPVLLYDFENGGLTLRKYVKESSVFVQASELKILEDREVEKDINSHLRKKSDKNYAIIGTWLLAIFLLSIGTYGVFELLNYNDTREFGEIRSKIEGSMATYDRGMKAIVTSCGNANKPLIDTIGSLVTTNQKLLESCIDKNLIDTVKLTVGE